MSYLQHVFVQANIIDVKTGSTQHTNDFKFTWGETDPGSPPLQRMVIPRTYAGLFLQLLTLC